MGKEENRKKMELQAQSVVRTAGEQLQVPLAAAEDPAERHLNETEDELLHTRGRLQTESLVGGDFPHEPDVEVADQGRKYHEHSVFFHEREGQVFPSEVHARLVHLDAVGFQLRECPLQGLGLLEFHIGVAVAVLDVEWVQVDLRDAGEVAVGFLVGVGRVVLLSLDELVVVVERHRLLFVDHAEL